MGRRSAGPRGAPFPRLSTMSETRPDGLSFSSGSRLRSFQAALSGLASMLRGEPNARIHLGAAAALLLAGPPGTGKTLREENRRVIFC